ncbi:hypothetical protein RUND412_011222 [Rhizina undulata]
MIELFASLAGRSDHYLCYRQGNGVGYDSYPLKRPGVWLLLYLKLPEEEIVQFSGFVFQSMGGFAIVGNDGRPKSLEYTYSY